MSNISRLSLDEGSIPRPPAEAFRIETRPDRHRVLVAPHGELDLATAADLAEEIEGSSSAASARSSSIFAPRPLSTPRAFT